MMLALRPCLDTFPDQQGNRNMSKPHRFAALGLAFALLAGLVPSGWAQTPQPSRPATVPARPPAPVAIPARPASPAVAPAPAAAPAAATGNRIDINAASEPQLDSLPGIGPARAKAIIAGRPYEDIQDLVKKKVLTTGVLAGIKDRIALANINTSSAADLQRTLPGVGDVRSKAIVAGRPYATPADLVAKKVLTQGVYDGIKDLVAY